MKEKQQLNNRKPAVAGQFYPGEADRLQSRVDDLFAEAKPKEYNNVRALILPHAGYVFSGKVAAGGYNQIDDGKKYKRVFLLASSHHITFDGASVYNAGDYETPLGTVQVDLKITGKLISENDVFVFNENAHIKEHSIEVQLPFLQKKLGDDIKIIPIVIGVRSADACKTIADGLKPYFNPDNLFVISTDFSHYPTYDHAVEVDKTTALSIATNRPGELISTLRSNQEQHLPGLSTSLCGWSAVLTLMHLADGEPGLKTSLLEYRNSGDSPYGDKNSVVGYYSMVMHEQNNGQGMQLDEKDKLQLINVARKTVHNVVLKGKLPAFDEGNFGDNLKVACGAFVTLKKNGELRGCIGNFSSKEPLWKVVREMAVAAATKDTRFFPVREDELDDLEIEVSVLTPMKKVFSIDEIILGRHGIYIKKGWSSGTFLPQVAIETGWTKEEFLGHCARDKAHIGWEGWKDAEVYTYEAIVFGEHDFK